MLAIEFPKAQWFHSMQILFSFSSVTIHAMHWLICRQACTAAAERFEGRLLVWLLAAGCIIAVGVTAKSKHSTQVSFTWQMAEAHSHYTRAWPSLPRLTGAAAGCRRIARTHRTGNTGFGSWATVVASEWRKPFHGNYISSNFPLSVVWQWTLKNGASIDHPFRSRLALQLREIDSGDRRPCNATSRFTHDEVNNDV